MSGSVSSEQAEPNLTPILDMVFQLITFFMLVVNFKSANIDQTLKLPVVGSARPVESKAGNLLILNIDQEGKLKVQGVERPDVETFIKAEGAASRTAARARGHNIKPGDTLPDTIVIRADRAARFKLVYNIIKKCQEQGFESFDYLAHNKVE